MDKLIQPSAQLYGIGNFLFEKSLENLDDAEARKTVGDDSNPIIWILGHLTVARCGLLGVLGKKVEHNWGERFARGTDPKDRTEFPFLKDVTAKWKQVAELLMARLEELTDEELSAKSPHDYPVPDKTIRGAITFMAYHEGYHAGQLAYLRKWLGKGSLVG